MRDVHLYFVKLFGCQIVDGKIAIELKPFSMAILEARPHPDVFLAFGKMSMPVQMVGASDVDADLHRDGRVAFASWLYQVGELSVNLLYAPEGQRRSRPAIRDAWHPALGVKRLPFVDFDARIG